MGCACGFFPCGCANTWPCPTPPTTIILKQTINLMATMVDSGGNPIDPSVGVLLEVRLRTDLIFTENYPGNITKVSTGVYTYPFTPTAPGTYVYRFTAQGTQIGEAVGEFLVVTDGF